EPAIRPRHVELERVGLCYETAANRQANLRRGGLKLQVDEPGTVTGPSEAAAQPATEAAAQATAKTAAQTSLAATQSTTESAAAPRAPERAPERAGAATAQRAAQRAAKSALADSARLDQPLRSACGLGRRSTEAGLGEGADHVHGESVGDDLGHVGGRRIPQHE